MITGSSSQQLSRQPKQFDFDDFYKGREPQRRMRDNMAIESRSDQVYVKPPADFSVSSTVPGKICFQAFMQKTK